MATTLATAHDGMTIEHWLVLSNMAIVLVSLALVVVTAMDAHALERIALALVKAIRPARSHAAALPTEVNAAEREAHRLDAAAAAAHKRVETARRAAADRAERNAQFEHENPEL